MIVFIAAFEFQIFEALSRYTKTVSRKALAAGNSPAKTGG